MRFDVVTLFPELFAPHLAQGVTRRAFGSAQVDVRLWLLRDFAKSKGFQRLGKNVRKGLETELDMLSRKGKILIKGGVIQLL